MSTQRLTYKNIPGWFPEENVALLDRLIKEHDVKTVLEIGAFVGKSTVFFAERCKHVTTIDPFNAIELEYVRNKFGTDFKQYQNFIRNTDGYSNITVYHDYSDRILSYMSKLFDLIYIDGSHEHEDVKQDIQLCIPLASKILCGDDYTEWWPGVVKAVDELLPHANKEQRLWHIVKQS